MPPTALLSEAANILREFADAAVFDQQNAVSRLCQPVIVRDHDEGHADLAVHLAHQGENVLTGPAIEVASRFVGQDDPRRIGEGAHDGTALVLAAAHGVGMILQAVSQTDALQEVDHAGALRLTHAAMADDER